MDQDEIAALAKEQRRVFYACFSTPEGQEVLQHMATYIDADDMRGATTEETYFNLGRRDVYRYIRHIMKLAEEGALDER